MVLLKMCSSYCLNNVHQIGKVKKVMSSLYFFSSHWMKIRKKV